MPLPYETKRVGEVSEFIQNNLSKWQDNGHPFASFNIDSIEYDERNAVLRGSIHHGPVVLNGPVIIHGDSSISSAFISRWIRYKKDDPFSCRRADRVPGLLKTIPFVDETRSSELEWFGNQAVLHVHLKKAGSSSFNGILGLLPGQDADNSMLLTGNVEADFSNLFNRGLGFSLRWSRFAASSQMVFMDLKVPSVGYSGLNFSGQFELFRQDSLYFKQRAKIDMGVAADGLWQFRIGLQTMNSNQNQPGLRISQTINSLVLGLEFESEPNGRIAPGRKFFQARFLPGYKLINKDNQDFRSSQIEFRVQGLAPLWNRPGRFSIRASVDFGMLSSKNLTLADQFRIGGLRSFRGFNENQFFTTRHGLLGIQPQFLLDSKFLLSIFCEGLMFQDDLKPENQQGFRSALGIGTGAEWEAGSNLVQISLASGIMKGLGPGLGSSKIHFGYIARF